MPFSPLNRYYPGLLLAGLSCLTEVVGVTSVSRPVGGLEITLLAETDNIVAPPFLRYSEQYLAINSVSGGNNEVWTLGSPAVPPSFGTNAYAPPVTDPPPQPTHFAMIETGPSRGKFFDILSHDATSVTIDPAGEILNPDDLEEERMKIYPHWTIGTFFKALEDFHPASFSGGSDAKVRIFLFGGHEGENPSAARTYYYYSGSDDGGPGWRRSGFNSTIITAHEIIDHTSYVIVRNGSTETKSFVMSGEVSTTSFSTPLLRILPTIAQDNVVGIASPIPVSLADSKLYESGAFKGSPYGGGFGGDSLFLFNPDQSGLNKSSNETFFFYTGEDDGGPGWRKKGSPLTIIQNNYNAFVPGLGVVVRKEPDGELPSFDPWFFTRPYENEY